VQMKIVKPAWLAHRGGGDSGGPEAFSGGGNDADGKESQRKHAVSRTVSDGGVCACVRVCVPLSSTPSRSYPPLLVGKFELTRLATYLYASSTSDTVSLDHIVQHGSGGSASGAHAFAHLPSPSTSGFALPHEHAEVVCHACAPIPHSRVPLERVRCSIAYRPRCTRWTSSPQCCMGCNGLSQADKTIESSSGTLPPSATSARSPATETTRRQHSAR
jgi:hypothetical protein